MQQLPQLPLMPLTLRQNRLRLKQPTNLLLKRSPLRQRRPQTSWSQLMKLTLLLKSQLLRAKKPPESVGQ
jgi:hypothetical protein